MKIGAFCLMLMVVAWGSSPYKDPTYSDTLALYLRQTVLSCDNSLFTGLLERLTFYYGDMNGTGGKHVSVFGLLELARGFWHILA